MGRQQSVRWGGGADFQIIPSLLMCHEVASDVIEAALDVYLRCFYVFRRHAAPLYLIRADRWDSFRNITRVVRLHINQNMHECRLRKQYSTEYASGVRRYVAKEIIEDASYFLRIVGWPFLVFLRSAVRC